MRKKYVTWGLIKLAHLKRGQLGSSSSGADVIYWHGLARRYRAGPVRAHLIWCRSRIALDPSDHEQLYCKRRRHVQSERIGSKTLNLFIETFVEQS